jgi:hypothetical protein
MKIASTIARYLLGLIFVVFGLNGFLHFMPLGPMPTGIPGQFMGALFASHYVVPIYGCQVIGGVLLLLNRYVPLGLTILAPVIFNILIVHILMLPQGLALAVVVLILWILVFLSVRSAFDGILQK